MDGRHWCRKAIDLEMPLWWKAKFKIAENVVNY